MENVNIAVPQNTATAAANTAVIMTWAADTRRTHYIGNIAWSYNADPTGGRLSIANGGIVCFDIDITRSGPGFIEVAFRGSRNAPVVVTLSAGGAGVVGKLSVLEKEF